MDYHTTMESEDMQDFGEAMKQFFDMEYENEKCHHWNDSGHTKTTCTTFMSDDYDEDIDGMMDAEDEPTYLIDTHSFDAPIPFNRDVFTSRRRSREWSTLGEVNLSLASFFDDPIDIPEISMSLDPPSQTPMYNNYSVFDHNCCEMAPTMFDDCSEQFELPLPTPIPAVPLPQELSHGCGEIKLNSQRKFRAPNLVGDLNFDSFHVSRPVSTIHFLGKLSSPIEHPLAERVKSGIRKPKEKMQCSLRKQATDSMLMCSNLDHSSNSSNKVASGLDQKWGRRIEPFEKAYVEITDNDVLLGQGGQSNRRPGNTCTSNKQATNAMGTFSNVDNSNCAKLASGLGQKRCRRIEPLEKEYVEITDNDVLLGRGGLSNRHPGNIVYRQHILEHQREYKLLKTDAKTEMSMEVVAWVKRRGGRFLKRDENAPGQPYYIATDVTARQKVSQALREDHTPEGRQQKKSRTKAYQT